MRCMRIATAIFGQASRTAASGGCAAAGCDCSMNGRACGRPRPLQVWRPPPMAPCGSAPLETGCTVWIGDGFEPVVVSPDAGNVASVWSVIRWHPLVWGGGGRCLCAPTRRRNSPLVPGTEQDSIRVIARGPRQASCGSAHPAPDSWCSRDAQPRRYTRGEGLSDDRVLCLAEGPDGALWIGTEHGLNRMRDGRFESFFREDGLGSDTVRSMWMDPEGSALVGHPERRTYAPSRWPVRYDHEQSRASAAL